MKILGTGLRGLVGSRIVELLKHGYEFEISDIDITDRHRIIERIESSNSSVVLHLAAKTDVDGCEKDREEDIKYLSLRGTKNERRSNPPRFEIASPVSRRARNDKNKEKTAWAVNVFGTKNIVDACQESNKKLIYISTDFVFDGEKASEYTEEDTPNPIDWYAKTKYEGEKIVQSSSCPWIIARLAYPYRSNFTKNDFARAILKRLQNKEQVLAVTDHIFTPTFIDDIAHALDVLIKSESTGIFHVVGSQSLSPYDATKAIAKIFGFDQKEIQKTTRSEFFKDRASRPFHLALKNDKIENLGVKMRGFEEGLEEIKKQMFTLSS